MFDLEAVADECECTVQEVCDFLEKEHEKALKSYENTTLEPRFCYKCGALMRAGSMAYIEGYHFDSCY